MQRLLHPDPEEVQRILAQHIYCPYLEARISPQQCRVNQKRAQSASWEETYNIFAYGACRSCAGVELEIPKPQARKNTAKCNKCGRVLSTQRFDLNPKTQERYRTCKRCRAPEVKTSRRYPQTSSLPDLPVATVTADASTMLIHRRSIIEFQINDYPFIQFLKSPLRMRLLSQRTQGPRVCKITSKGNTRHPNYTVAIARIARELGIPAHEVFALKARKDGTILLRAI